MKPMSREALRKLQIVLLIIAAALFALALTRGPARGQGARDPELGRELAVRLCSGCHAIGIGGPSARVHADVPSFREIANRTGQTAERIAGRIVVPHPPMPQVSVTRDEIAALTAFILTQRERQAPPNPALRRSKALTGSEQRPM